MNAILNGIDCKGCYARLLAMTVNDK